ncbi:MAG: type 1 glutamine amidotransferase [Rhizobiales bacterium]|nr:type 1 glutamine amidotransferase [Hyphomicrobiales bacterium]
MSSTRLLVIDGNTAKSRALQIAAGGVASGQGYADLLRELLPGAAIDICYPADSEMALPLDMAIEAYDGTAITGSALHVYDGGPAVERQIELVKAVLRTGVPVFGSCWGLQVLTAAAGGTVRKNPKGREAVYGRGIHLNVSGRAHPMYAGKAEVFDAITFHLDEVETVAPGTIVLAANAVSAVQAMELRVGKSVAWAVQYHPEYSPREVAAIVRRTGIKLVGEGVFTDTDALTRCTSELDALDRNPDDRTLASRHRIDGTILDKPMRVREVANWIEHQVKPTRSQRGRG